MSRNLFVNMFFYIIVYITIYEYRKNVFNGDKSFNIFKFIFFYKYVIISFESIYAYERGRTINLFCLFFIILGTDIKEKKNDILLG